MSEEFFELAWKICFRGGFVAGKEAAQRFSLIGAGTIIFTGATASVRS